MIEIKPILKLGEKTPGFYFSLFFRKFFIFILHLSSNYSDFIDNEDALTLNKLVFVLYCGIIASNKFTKIALLLQCCSKITFYFYRK